LLITLSHGKQIPIHVMVHWICTKVLYVERVFQEETIK